jgi:thiol-disulfide isomerase/thioredoxin
MRILALVFTIFAYNFVIAQNDEKFSSIDNHQKLLARIHLTNDTLYVVNFWATWCKPCVEELPFLLTSADDMSGMPIKFLFISLDFSNQIETKLLPFIKTRNIKEEIIALTDQNSNAWIDAFSPEWDGAIPATFFYQNGIQLYKEFGSFHSSEEINEIIKSL